MDRSCTKLICTPCQWKHVYFFTHPCSQLITQQTFLLSMIREHLKGKFKLAFETCATLWVHLCSHQPNIHICFWFWISRSCSDAVFSKILSNLHHLIESPCIFWSNQNGKTSYRVWIRRPCLCFFSVLDLQVFSAHRLGDFDDALTRWAIGLAKFRGGWRRCTRKWEKKAFISKSTQ